MNLKLPVQYKEGSTVYIKSFKKKSFIFQLLSQNYTQDTNVKSSKIILMARTILYIEFINVLDF